MDLEIISRRPAADPHPTPLLFVHGAWHAAWCWEPYFLPYFAEQGYASHALSLRGHGASEGHLRSARIKDYVADVRGVIDTLPAPPVLIGHSMGGLVVQKTLEEVDLSAAVLLASLPASGSTMFFLRYVRRHPLPFLRFLFTLDSYKFLETPDLTHDLMHSADMSPEQVREYHRHIQAESLAALPDTSFLALPRPSRVNTPLLVIGAEDDRVFTVREVERTARAYDTEPVIFPNMAHDMMLEPNWRVVADHILSWLQERDL